MSEGSSRGLEHLSTIYVGNQQSGSMDVDNIIHRCHLVCHVVHAI
jgi:hypothetical protein